MWRVFSVGALVWAAGMGQVPMNMMPIPDEFSDDSYRIARLIVQVRLDITTGAGGGCTSKEQMEWISNVLVRAFDHVFVNMNGRQSIAMCEYHKGVNDDGFPAAIIANQANVIVPLVFDYPFSADDAFCIDDFHVPAKLFNDGTIFITFGAAAMNANTTVNACTVEAFAQVARKNDVSVPALIEIGAISTNSMENQIAQGVYTDLFILDPVAATFAAANLTSLQVVAKGESIIGSVPPDATLRAYAADKYKSIRGIANAPIGQWEDCAADIWHIPLIWTMENNNRNKATQFVDTGDGPLLYRFLGTLTNPILCYRRYLPMGQSDAAKQLVAQGVTDVNALDMKIKTASKSPTVDVTKTGAKILPRKVTGAKSASALGGLVGRFSRTPRMIGSTTGLKK